MPSRASRAASESLFLSVAVRLRLCMGVMFCQLVIIKVGAGAGRALKPALLGSGSTKSVNSHKAMKRKMKKERVK